MRIYSNDVFSFQVTPGVRGLVITNDAVASIPATYVINGIHGNILSWGTNAMIAVRNCNSLSCFETQFY